MRSRPPAAWLAILTTFAAIAACYELRYPPEIVALGDDLRIEVYNVTWPAVAATNATAGPDLLQPPTQDTIELLLGKDDPKPRALVKVGLRQGQGGGAPVVYFPCKLFWHGGAYFLRYNNGSSVAPLAVKWYNVTLLNVTDQLIHTFQDSVSFKVKFSWLTCPESASLLSAHKEEGVAFANTTHLQLQLVFCGHSTDGCVPGRNRSQLLHSEVIWPDAERPLDVHLSCDLFGQAGRYLIWILGFGEGQPKGNGSLLVQSRALRVEWSDKFVFNVFARSIFPCDMLPSASIVGGGSRGDRNITVLFTYPDCILPDSDRVRVFARKESAMSSVDPTSLIYVTEQRVTKGQHSAAFPCSLFTENYLEYCFVYVSGAKSGAASDVRVDCVPTLPIGDSAAGAWGSWSSWTTCSSTCGYGVRNRYRFCDSPPPRYGAKFCEGKSLESEQCTNLSPCADGSGWTSMTPGAPLPAENDQVQAEVGSGCRCGCVIHLNSVKPRRLLAASSQSCPGRTFWLVQSDEDGQVVDLEVDHFRLACEKQWLKVRDGDSLAAIMVAHLTVDTQTNRPVKALASGRSLLLEFYSEIDPDSGTECKGGFLAHAQQRTAPVHNSSVPLLSGIGIGDEDDALDLQGPFRVATHLVAVVFMAVVVLMSCLLLVQYVVRYHKYQRTAGAEPISPCHSIGGSIGRFTSSTTLSEIISLRHFGGGRRGTKHERLKEEKVLEIKAPKAALEEDDEVCGSIESLPEKYEEDCHEKENENSDSERKPLTPKVHRKPHYSPNKKRKAKQKLRLQKSNISPVKEDTPKIKTESPNSSESVHITVQRTPPVAKASKEKQNRAKCLLQKKGGVARPTLLPSHARVLQAGSSEFSLTGTESEMEMDYYDYNVQNASAVPGSYLGMDPAYLVWIPPATPTGSVEGDDDVTVVFNNKDEGITASGEVVKLQTLAGEVDIDEEIKYADDDEEDEA
ncbi:uncharacterized protein LOC132193076 isoform X2 [Neocloeon triangulifer]|uniref:uncharacterized protein LOC132193076 isoform X2 n=1 Tax=Neocloeon triangulifer TaxID=2078957 RepID=UPI00286F571A|nr:uncharacterized protein LOC132193076 isoform X2 [Neocloeon triangulifer]